MNDKRRQEINDSVLEATCVLGAWLPEFRKVVSDLMSVSNNLPKFFEDLAIFCPENEDEYQYSLDICKEELLLNEFLDLREKINELL